MKTTKTLVSEKTRKQEKKEDASTPALKAFDKSVSCRNVFLYLNEKLLKNYQMLNGLCYAIR